MKKLIFALFIGISALTFTACERVAPNYVGVLMENYGKSKSDYSVVKGRVNTSSPGTELFQVPSWEQRASMDSVLHLQAADQTEFTSNPRYSYILTDEKKAVDLVFQNSRLGSGEEFMQKLESNILEAAIYDIVKDASREYSTDTLMSKGGSIAFERHVQPLVAKEFENRGLTLKTFTVQLEFSKKVREKIDSRNEVNTNISVLDQQIAEQRKRNELAALKAEENRILSSGITNQLLQQQFIDAWRETKQPLYGGLPTFMKSVDK